MTEAPRVFISYSHDSAGHKLRVLELANRLRREGIDARLDRYVQFPSEGWPRWMHREIEEADVVLVVCTEIYKGRFDGTDASGKGLGVRWEGLILTQTLYEDLSRDVSRFIPVLFDDTPPMAVPIAFRSFSHFNLPDQYDSLYRVLTNQPEVEVPTIGAVRPLTPIHPAIATTALPVVSSGADQDLQAKQPVGSEAVLRETKPSWAIINEPALEILRDRWSARRLTLMLGAGVSIMSGLPTWADLLSDLLAAYVERTYSATLSKDAIGSIHETLQNEIRNTSPIQTAEFIRSQVSSSDFTDMLRTSLYRNHQTNIEQNRLIDAIVSLHPGIHGIVSFNFDDILEEALSRAGVDYTAIISGRDLGRIKGLPVYHPHGYLPRNGEGSSAIVFSESEYHTQYTEAYSWTNIVVQRLLLESTCLFVGTSLSDPNLRRMIDLSHRQNPDQRHYYLTIASRHSEDFLRGVVSEIFQASYEAIGVIPIWIEAYDEIPSLLEAICCG